MKEKLIIVTSNPLKFSELSLELNKYFDCEQGIVPGYHEIQGDTDTIVRHKLNAAYEHFKSRVLVDDTSVHFEELGGFPGPYMRDFINHIPILDMGKKFAGTRIKVSCRLGLFDGINEPIIATGTIEGDVVIPPDVDPGHKEFDIFTQIDGTDKTMFYFSPEEKNKHSHRGMALKDLISKLN
jgi:inosine triphosphate pyrophosphatase